MMFITGPLYSGKRTFARNFRGSVIADVQDAAAETQTPEQLETLARELAEYDIVIATEVGGGVVPMDAEERAGREAAGRLACLLAERADCVVQMFCGIPTVLKENYPNVDLSAASRPDRIQCPEALSGPARHPALGGGPEASCAGPTSTRRWSISPAAADGPDGPGALPEAELVVVKDLQEMCFGSFEGKNYVEMEHDADYQAWVQANCESKCPDGERKDDFSNRICNAFSALVDKALADGEELLVILAHGGTQMAALERYALPRRGYYAWCGPNAGGYVLDAADWAEKRQLRLVKTVQYTKDAEAGV